MPVRYRSLPFLFCASGPSKLGRSAPNKNARQSRGIHLFGGEGGIRTPGTVARTTVFETATIDRSATSPKGLTMRIVGRGAKIMDLGQFFNYEVIGGKGIVLPLNPHGNVNRYSSDHRRRRKAT